MNFRHLSLAIILTTSMQALGAMKFNNDPLPVLDPRDFQGKWYSLTSTPTPLDKDWLETAETYTPCKGGYSVHTTYRRDGETQFREISSKLFLPKKGPQGALKAQFIWPFKVDYTIIKIAADGTWMVGGSPDKKMLFILSRTPSLPPGLLREITERCGELGYPVATLKSQQHTP